MQEQEPISLTHDQSSTPDISYVISMVSQIMHFPLECHIDTILRILRYMKPTPRKGLLFSKNNHLRIVAYPYVRLIHMSIRQVLLLIGRLYFCGRQLGYMEKQKAISSCLV